MSLHYFSIGDEVIVNDNARGQYIMTVPGSIGIIVSILTATIIIEFTNLGYSYGGRERFSFHVDELEQNFNLVSSSLRLSKHDKKYEKIIVKIKYLQAKRKAKGYAY